MATRSPELCRFCAKPILAPRVALSLHYSDRICPACAMEEQLKEWVFRELKQDYVKQHWGEDPDRDTEDELYILALDHACNMVDQRKMREEYDAWMKIELEWIIHDIDYEIRNLPELEHKPKVWSWQSGDKWVSKEPHVE